MKVQMYEVAHNKIVVALIYIKPHRLWITKVTKNLIAWEYKSKD